MSKKSRRRNKKILGALAAIGTGLALANRGKGMEDSNISVDSGRGGDSSSAMARKVANTVAKKSVYPDAIMRGGKGAVIPDNLPITSANVQRNLVDPPLKGLQDRNRNMNFGLGDYTESFKKGGRVGCGKAKRGFGKAMRKGRK
jgi:hypothetical protein